MTEAAPAASEGLDLTEAEQKYFESGGESVEGLTQAPQEPAQHEPGKPATPPTEQQQAQPPQQQAEQRDPEEEELGEDGRPKNAGRYVRHGAFHAEREKRKAAEARAREIEEKYARVDERLKLFNDAIQGAQTQQQRAQHAQARQLPPPPNKEEDPFGYMAWQDQRAQLHEEQLGEVRQYLAQFGQMTVEQQQERHLQQAYAADAQRFASEKPDFGQAYRHLLQSRDKELELAGYRDPQQRAAIIHDEERALVMRALSERASPSEIVYSLAVARGHVPPAPNGSSSAQQAAPVAPPASGNGTQQAKPGALEAIERIQQGQQASRSLSNAGGSPGGQLTPDVLANMSQDEFNSMLRKLSPAQERALFGG